MSGTCVVHAEDEGVNVNARSVRRQSILDTVPKKNKVCFWLVVLILSSLLSCVQLFS